MGKEQLILPKNAFFDTLGFNQALLRGAQKPGFWPPPRKTRFSA